MKKILATLVLAFSAVFAHAQGVIAVQGSSRNAVFTDLKAAYEYAQSGDNIYLPAGAFSFTFEIAKHVHFFGAGYNPLVAGATGITTINGDVSFAEGSEDGGITGMYVTGTINLGSASLVARRCNANRIWMGGANTEVTVTECIARQKVDMSFHGPEVKKYILNSIIGRLEGFNNSQPAIIRNNIFMAQANGGWAIYWINGGVCENNIFLTSNPSGDKMNYASGTLVFRNNIFVCPQAKAALNEGVWEEGNQFGIDINQLCVSVSDPTVFKSTHDYHLKAASPARMGTESNEQDDAGIYGGILPWKDGGLPFFPHIETNNTAYSATGNKLQLRMKVKAQSN